MKKMRVVISADMKTNCAQPCPRGTHQSTEAQINAIRSRTYKIKMYNQHYRHSIS